MRNYGGIVLRGDMLMSEKKMSVEELSRRIDQLLDVLNTISRDLADISKALKAGGVPGVSPAVSPAAAAPAERLRTVEDVRMLFSPDLEEMLSFEESGDFIVVKPRGFLGRDNFTKIASIVRGAGGEYISAGKGSHFRLPRGME
jgi:hypothetical protein